MRTQSKGTRKISEREGDSRDDGLAKAGRLLAFEETLVDESGETERGAPLLATMTMMRDGESLSYAHGASSNVAAFSPGYVLSERYRIRERIGKGGFGFVYAAHDLELDVPVAIKVLRPEVDGNREMVRRFKKEIQLARRVTHQNVCRIYDVGFYEFGELRVPFLSMELLEGESLAERIRRRGTIAQRTLKPIATQVAAGLEAAHRVGIVHADLKPGNVMLVGEGEDTRAVVTDFGLASAHAAEVESKNAAIVGTPAYMAPEQVRGDALTPATDFYALGCTLFHALSGELPFAEDSVIATAEARLSGQVPRLRSKAGIISSQWSTLVRDMMNVAPEKRLASTKEIERRLQSTTTRRVAIGAVIVAVVLAIALVVAIVTRPAPYVEPVFSLSLPDSPAGRARYEEGMRLWNDFEGVAALKVWEDAVADGFVHPSILRQICHARRFLYQVDELSDCYDRVFQAAGGLSADERSYYEGMSYRFSEQKLEGFRILVELLAKYPGEFEISLALIGAQRNLGEHSGALKTAQRIKPKNDYERVASQASKLGILTQMKRYADVVEEGAGVLEEARRHGFHRQELNILESLSQSYRNLGKLEESKALGQRSLKLAQQIGSTRDEAMSISLLSAIAMKEQRYADAEELLQKRTAFLLQNGNDVQANQMLITKAELMLVTGRVREADAVLTFEALPRLRSDDNTYWEGYALVSRAEVRRALGRPEDAIEDCYAAEAIFRGIQSVRLQAFAKMVCGFALLDAGRMDDAERELTEAHRTRQELGLELLLLQNELATAEMLVARGKPEEAYVIAADVALEYRKRDLPADELIAQELAGRAALAAGNLEGAKVALTSSQGIARGENTEVNLQLDALAARIAIRTDASPESVAALHEIAKRAEDAGYIRLARELGQSPEAGQGR